MEQHASGDDIALPDVADKFGAGSRPSEMAAMMNCGSPESRRLY